MLTLFHKFSLQGYTDIHDVVEPSFVFKGRHDLASADLGVFQIAAEPAIAHASCRELDLTVSLGDYSSLNSRFSGQLDHFIRCLNSDGPRHDDVEATIQFLQEDRTEHWGKNYLHFTIDMFHKLDLTTEQLGYMGRSFIEQVDSKRFFKMLDSVPLLVSGIPGEVREVIRPAFDLLRPIFHYTIRPSLTRLESYAGRVLRRVDFPLILGYVDRIMDRKPELAEPSEAASRPAHEWARIKQWVGIKECLSLPPNPTQQLVNRYKDVRALQIAGDFDHAITTSDLVNGQQRRSWGFEEFRAFLDPVLTKMIDDTQGVRPGAQIDALLNTLRYFTLPEGKAPNRYQHYTRTELLRFLVDRSEGRDPITYFFDGDFKRRVRWVTMMDRLEMVLTNADFWSPYPFEGNGLTNKRNFSMHFMGRLAESWGDLA